MTVALMDISLDRSYKWRYNPVVQKRRVQQWHVGPQGLNLLPGIPAGLTIDSSNALYVNVQSGSDTTGDGTSGNPYKTMNNGANMCTATYCYVIATYTSAAAYTPGDGPFTTNYNLFFKGCFAAAGKTIYWTHRALGFTPDDTNAIWMKKTGSDSNAGTQAAPVLTLTGATGAISKCTASKQKVMIMDDGEYTEIAFEFTGNFLGLYAYYGYQPTIKFTQNPANPKFTEWVLNTYSADGTYTSGNCMCAKFSDNGYVSMYTSQALICFVLYQANGYQSKARTSTLWGSHNGPFGLIVLPGTENVVVLWENAGSGDLYYGIYNKTMTTKVKADTAVTSVGNHAAHLAAFSDGTFVIAWGVTTSSNSYFYRKYDSTGTSLTGPIWIDSADSANASINVAVQSDDKMIFTYAKTVSAVSYLCLAMITYDGLELLKTTTTTVLGSALYQLGRNSTVMFSDDSFASLGINDTSIFAVLFDYKGQGRKKFTVATTDATTTINKVTAAVTKNDHMNVIWSKQTASSSYWTIFDSDGNRIFAEANFLPSSQMTYVNAFVNDYGETIFFDDEPQSNPCLWYGRMRGYMYVGMYASANATIHGVTFDLDGHEFMKYAMTGVANISRKWCEFKNHKSAYYSYSGPYGRLMWAGITSRVMTTWMNGGTSLEFYSRFEYIHDSDYGNCIISDHVSNNYGIFLNNDGWHMNVTGAAGTAGAIDYRFNLVKSAKGGFYIDGNTGTNEYCYDNIFEDVSAYAVQSAANFNVYNCCLSGCETYGVTEVACVYEKALFLNGGEISSDEADLELMSIDMGDYDDSPCLNLSYYGIGDIGPYATQRRGPDPTYTEFTVVGKPLVSFERNIKFAGAVKYQMDDGAWTTDVDGAGEVITLNHDQKAALHYSEFLNWLDMMVIVKNPAAQFCPNPVTAPNTWWNVTLFFDDTAAYAPTYKLDSEYKCKVKYSFAYKLQTA